MGRRPKCRRIGFVPGITYYKPAGIPLAYLEEVVLALEELEALRLKDLEDLEQEECAQRMGISRPTFFRILGEARRKVADALVSGKAIRIEGGQYEFSGPEMPVRQFACQSCGHQWEEPFGCGHCGASMICPRCASADIRRTDCGPLAGRHRHGHHPETQNMESPPELPARGDSDGAGTIPERST